MIRPPEALPPVIRLTNHSQLNLLLTRSVLKVCLCEPRRNLYGPQSSQPVVASNQG